MRASLFYNPAVLLERLAVAVRRRRRFVRLRQTPAQSLRLGHIESLELLELIRPLDVRVVYDVGAHVGTWSLLAKSLFPQASIDAFEPLASHCDRFRQSAGRLAGVSLHQIALGRTDGEAPFHVVDFTDASSFLRLSPQHGTLAPLKETGVENVPVRRLDNYALENNLPTPDLMKLDVQGYELSVLEGAARTFPKAKALIAEVSFVELYEGQCLLHDLVGVLAREGFHLRAFSVGTPLGEFIEQTDVLFIRQGVL